jgi:small-conductance mechanosensitive channel
MTLLEAVCLVILVLPPAAARAQSNPAAKPSSVVRVRFIRLGSFSLDVDVFAYLRARDWNHFLEIQEQLLFSVMNVVQEAGTEVAFPSQTLYVASAQGALSGASDFRQSPTAEPCPFMPTTLDERHQWIRFTDMISAGSPA